MKPLVLTDIEGTTSSISFVKGEPLRSADAFEASAAIANAQPRMAGPDAPMPTTARQGWLQV